MERAIKFRAWNKKNKSFEDAFFISNRGKFKRLGVIQNSDNIEIMQYTGLKDRNCVEIYDGDIIEDEEGKRSFITYNESYGAFCFSNEPYIGIGSKSVEVIGNVHQNPELL